MNDVLQNLYEILRKVIQIEKEVEELKIVILKMVSENLPEEEIDKETLDRLKVELKI